MENDKIYNCDCLEGLRKMPDDCIDCCVTSPPYYGLRDYGVDGQIGLEETPQAYIDRLTDVFMEVYRVLKPEGTLWLNIGDSYVSKPKSNYDGKAPSLNDKSYGTGDTTLGYKAQNERFKELLNIYKNKDLIGIPWMLAFNLRAKGWYLRQDIIWHKPNPMPESVTDRCTKSHEYIFLFSKSKKYYFDYKAIQEPAVSSNKPRVFGANNQKGTMRNDIGRVFTPKKSKNVQNDGQKPNTMHLRREQGLPDEEYSVRNKRDVWSVNTKPDSVAHFATYPEELIRPCILAGCPKDGIVLDPFMGSGTTARVARKYGRNFIGFELNPEYIKIIEKKIIVEQDMFV